MAEERAQRQDGFTDERKRLFLAAIAQGDSVLAACARVGVSNRTAYNHRRIDPDFARGWALARRASRLPLDLLVFMRAVDGTAETVIVNGVERRVTRPPSDYLLARLLEGEKPELYGRTAGIRAQGKLRKRLKRLAARIEALEAERMRSTRNPDFVNFVNRPERPSRRVPAPRRRGEQAPGWRLAAVRRRLAAADNRS
ncbi:MAG: hypothetical protein QOG72_2985 [Sphingomonadales bacterium]|jgi:hypothetical protein|nr:hypothetical protein [Sphingomonadales bacterium]